MSLGFFITAHKEIRATEELLKNIRTHHQSDPIYLISDGGYNFQEIIFKLGIDNVHFSLEKDSLGPTFSVTDKNFTSEESKMAIKNAIDSFLKRMQEAIKLLEVDYMIVLDPDTKFKRNIDFMIGPALLGSLVNSHLPKEFNDTLENFGGLRINKFGANPAIFRTDKFLEGLHEISNFGNQFFEELSNSFYGVYAYDLLIPIVMSMAGELEQFNSEIIECKRNRFWRFSKKSIVHQYRRYYTK